MTGRSPPPVLTPGGSQGVLLTLVFVARVVAVPVPSSLVVVVVVALVRALLPDPR